MSKKLYILSIGGSGVRVLKQFIAMFAGGVNLGDFETIVPVVIDEDSTNGSYNDSIEFLKTYNTIHEAFRETDQKKFFGGAIEAVNEKDFVEDYRLILKKDESRVKECSFEDFMGTEDEINKKFLKLLYSKNSLEKLMREGFYGEPNVGCTVYSVLFDGRFDDEKIKRIFKTFQKGDRIFIISSIFGGTGAAGFPVLLKKIKTIPATENAIVGGVSLLPYFKVEDAEEKRVDSEAFNSKVKAALEYYKTSVKPLANIVYYVGDNKEQPIYERAEGGTGQNKFTNPANFIEFVAATSIVDFATTEDADLEGNKTRNFYCQCKEDGKEINKLYFKHLYKDSRDRDKQTILFKNIQRSMAAFYLFTYFMNNSYKDNAPLRKTTWGYSSNNWVQNCYRKEDGPKINEIMSFCDEYYKMLKNMSEQGRKFTPFQIDNYNNVDQESAFDVLNGINKDQKQDALGKTFNAFLLEYGDNKEFNTKNQTHSNIWKLLSLFSETCKAIIAAKYKNI